MKLTPKDLAEFDELAALFFASAAYKRWRREQFAKEFVAALIASDRKPAPGTVGEEWRATHALVHADALIAKLDGEPGPAVKP